MTTTDTNEDLCKKAEPQKEHEWLGKFLGDWTFEAECSMGPGEPAFKNQGRESVKSLGGLWIVAEGEGEMPGGDTGQTMMTLGYDPKRQRYVGTWVGSMMSHMWIYDGELDASGKILTLNAEGPSFVAPNKVAQYQDVIEFKSDDHRILRSRVMGEDGKWGEYFVTAHYRRKG